MNLRKLFTMGCANPVCVLLCYITNERKTKMNDEYNEHDEQTTRLLDQICEGVETGTDTDQDDTGVTVDDHWDVGSIVEHEGALYRITECQTRMESDGESAWSRDEPYSFTLKNIETGELETLYV